MSLSTNVLGVIQILLQFFAAYLSYRIYLFERLSKAWLAVTTALILMALRRITALLIGLGALPQLDGFVSILDRLVLPFLISVLLALGLWGMLRNFERFEVIEKKISKFKK